jgi:hypothetical protein
MRGTVIVAILAGCYSPTLPTGAPCTNGVCPRGLVCSPATATCELSAVEADAAIDVASDGLGDAPADSPIDGPVSPYSLRRRVTITNNSNATMPTGFSIRVRLDIGALVAGGKARSDLADLRVIHDTAGERDRIIDPPGGQAPMAVNFALVSPLAPGASTSAYALYYGRPTAGAAPASGAAVFQLYDDFNSTIASFWLRNDVPSVVGGKLVLRANHQDALTTTASNDNIPIVSAIELVAKVVDPNSDPTTVVDGTFFYWFGYQHTGDFSASDPWAVWIARGKGAISGEQKSPVGCEAGCDGAPIGQNTASRYFQIERDPAATRFYADGTLSHTATVTNSSDYSVIVRNYMATSDLQVDWIRARARVSPDPTAVLAAEELL